MVIQMVFLIKDQNNLKLLIMVHHIPMSHIFRHQYPVQLKLLIMIIIVLLYIDLQELLMLIIYILQEFMQQLWVIIH
jgi:hypothetical protein